MEEGCNRARQGEPNTLASSLLRQLFCPRRLENQAIYEQTGERPGLAGGGSYDVAGIPVWINRGRSTLADKIRKKESPRFGNRGLLRSKNKTFRRSGGEHAPWPRPEHPAGSDRPTAM